MPSVDDLTLLSPLAGLKNLRELKLHSNYVFEAEVQKLQQVLPDCKIGHAVL